MQDLKLTIIAILCIFLAFVFVRTICSAVSRWRAEQRTAAIAVLDNELAVLCNEVSRLSSVRLTTELVPQRFPSKNAAQSFGEKWSMGGADSFKAKALDGANRDEDHPQFDSTSVSGGILYSYPALFFGMNEAYRKDDEWLLSFARARNAWLKSYLTHLKNGS